jgi:pentose-5-phosphate-3-epimerase
VHVLIVEPELYLTSFAKAGADHLFVQAAARLVTAASRQGHQPDSR